MRSLTLMRIWCIIVVKSVTLRSFLIADSPSSKSEKLCTKVLFFEIASAAYRTSHSVETRCQVGASFYTYLSGSGSSAEGRKLECKIISVEEQKQPVGKFPSGCLKWINLSNRLPSVDIQRVCAHSQTHMQTSKQRRTHNDNCTHPCFTRVPPTALHMLR